jgi:ubiquinone/menaquinone biosynthesis C-methylase UbiE
MLAATSSSLLDQLVVLSDGTRSRLLALLERHELTVSELCDVLQLPQSTVSRHLKTLGDGGWVASRRDGTSRLYSAPLDELDDDARRLWQLVRAHVASTAVAAQDDHRLKGALVRRRTKSEEFFASAAGQWDRLRAELFGASSHLHVLLGLVDEQWVVGDLGCGTGQVAEALAPFVSRVVAVDASADMLEAARLRLRDVRNVEFRRGGLEHLPLSDASLDAACMVLVLHHVAEPTRVLSEAARVVKPGGRVLVADMLPHDHDDYRQTMGHVWLGFPEPQVARWMTAAGFAEIRTVSLPSTPGAKGPALFVAIGRRGV